MQTGPITTRALWYVAPRECALNELTIEARPGEALVRTLFSGISRGTERLIFEGPEELGRMMQRYGAIDIALDPTPYNGGTTTLQALWMGVPVITLLGGNFVSRMGASFLSALGHPDWIATDHDHYRAIARQLASQLPALRQGRPALRQQMASSGLSDLDTYTSSFQKLLRRMWHSHCNGDGSTLLAAEI
jgi:predicted O-linked N-acetylglucosamine transferase (SPINDLY family)